VRNLIISEHDRQRENLFLLSFVHTVSTYIEEALPVLTQEPNLVPAASVPEVRLVSQSPKPFSKWMGSGRQIKLEEQSLQSLSFRKKFTGILYLIISTPHNH